VKRLAEPHDLVVVVFCGLAFVLGRGDNHVPVEDGRVHGDKHEPGFGGRHIG